MQRLCATIFCFLLLSTGMKDLIIYMAYLGNMETVGMRFCKNTTDLSCKGRCYLSEVFGKENTPQGEIPILPTPVDKVSFIVQKLALPKMISIESFLMLNIKQDRIPSLFGLSPPTPPPRFFIV